jgi:hypothetical protein
MLTKHTRRHSGWVYPDSTLKDNKPINIINECLEPQPYYDDWIDYRDGFRDYNDKTKIRNNYYRADVQCYNRKNKLLLKRRKAKQLRIKI